MSLGPGCEREYLITNSNVKKEHGTGKKFLGVFQKLEV
jgi:hypothetical protein